MDSSGQLSVVDSITYYADVTRDHVGDNAKFRMLWVRTGGDVHVRTTFDSVVSMHIWNLLGDWYWMDGG